MKPISQQEVQAETVQQVAFQQIQQTLPQVNILQAAVSSAGLSAVMMQPAASSAMPALSTVNTSQLAQTQLLPTVTFTNGAIQVQSAPIQVSEFIVLLCHGQTDASQCKVQNCTVLHLQEASLLVCSFVAATSTLIEVKFEHKLMHVGSCVAGRSSSEHYSTHLAVSSQLLS